MSDILKTIPDKQFWLDTSNNLKDYGKDVYRTLHEYGSIPGIADNKAENLYSNKSARDSSIKNAYRHALGTGMFQDKFAASPLISEDVASLLAKGLGFSWELASLGKSITNPKYRTDSLHDLNANSIGADTAKNTLNQAELEKALAQKANNSLVEQPVSFYERSPGHMTRSVR